MVGEDDTSEFQQRVIAAVASGELTIGEATRISGLSRLAVSKICKEAGIDSRKARAEYVDLLAEVMRRLASPATVN
jgi:histone H3/H4